MLDLWFVLAGLGFFVVAILYIYGCDWFIREDNNRTSVERIEASRDREQMSTGN